jgi:hypothetical protein
VFDFLFGCCAYPPDLCFLHFVRFLTHAVHFFHSKRVCFPLLSTTDNIIECSSRIADALMSQPFGAEPSNRSRPMEADSISRGSRDGSEAPLLSQDGTGTPMSSSSLPVRTCHCLPDSHFVDASAIAPWLHRFHLLMWSSCAGHEAHLLRRLPCVAAVSRRELDAVRAVLLELLRGKSISSIQLKYEPNLGAHLTGMFDALEDIRALYPATQIGLLN